MLVWPSLRLGLRVDVMRRKGEPLRPRCIPVYDEFADTKAVKWIVPEAFLWGEPAYCLLGELPRRVHAEPLCVGVLSMFAIGIAMVQIVDLIQDSLTPFISFRCVRDVIGVSQGPFLGSSADGGD